MAEEIFAPIPQFPGYFVGDHGTVLSTRRGDVHTLRPLIKSNGYISVNLSRSDARKTVTVHPLVAHAFISPRPEGMVVCHGDGNPLNNRIENLRWGTASDNVRDAIRHGTASCLRLGPPRTARRTHCRAGGHEYTPETTRLRPDGSRRCLICQREQDRTRGLRKRGANAGHSLSEAA